MKDLLKKMILIFLVSSVFVFVIQYILTNKSQNETTALNTNRSQYYGKAPQTFLFGKKITIAVIDTSFVEYIKEEQKFCFSESSSTLKSSCKQDCALEYAECNHADRVGNIIRNIAPKASLISYNVSSILENGKSVITQNNFISALKDLESKDIDILNLSLGFVDLQSECKNQSTEISKLLFKLSEKGIHIFAASGNMYSHSSNQYPACLPFVHSVGSIDAETKDISDFSNYNEYTKHFAISKYLKDENQDLFYGTSFATAIASSTQAIILERYPECILKTAFILDLDEILNDCQLLKNSTN
jgi:hypothetical protein